MTRYATQAKVALDKSAHPENYCPTRRCLWRTGGGLCPRHETGDWRSDYDRTVTRAHALGRGWNWRLR